MTQRNWRGNSPHEFDSLRDILEQIGEHQTEVKNLIGKRKAANLQAESKVKEDDSNKLRVYQVAHLDSKPDFLSVFFVLPWGAQGPSGGWRLSGELKAKRCWRRGAVSRSQFGKARWSLDS
jgi:hypothetical protein